MNRANQDHSVMVGAVLQSIRVRKRSVTLRFAPRGEFKREIIGGAYDSVTDWGRSLLGLKVIAVKEYREGLLLNFGLKGLLIGNDGEFHVMSPRPVGPVQ